ncbi:MAG: hypothetical protein HY744_01755 [Deltaproteobacteria bacterium]|nr:hypothetical protein [Deltaproteobacteria bacterium]
MKRRPPLLARSAALAAAALAVACVGCSSDDAAPSAPAADAGTDGGPGFPVCPSDSWCPGVVLPSLPGQTERGFLDLRGIVHAHSVYSHDACDGEPLDEKGKPNEQCLGELRTGLCRVRHEFLMLTDHRDSFAEHEFPEVLLYRAERGDELVERDGTPVANWAGCPDGPPALIMTGCEAGTMPVALERHVSDDPAERDELYGAATAEAIEALKAAGAVALVAHTEDWTAEQLVGLPLDGFEMFNLHANLFHGMGAAVGLIAKMEQPELLPHPDLIIMPIISEDPRYVDTWAQVLSRGARRTTVLATDCHRNSFPQKLPDGERVDGFRRMMQWFSNHLLVRPAKDGSWADRELAEALRGGRLYGAFEFLGYPEGFDFHATGADGVREMGEEVVLSGGPVTLEVALPHVRQLDAQAEPPELTLRILRATEQGWQEVSSDKADMKYTPSEPGAYRAEVRMVPRHLAAFLSSYADLAAADFVWIYSNPIYVKAEPDRRGAGR